MRNLSGFIIVKDSINTIKECLDALSKVAEEIIVVDTGSSDGTLEFLLNYRDDVDFKVYQFQWVNHFAKARNFALSKCGYDWCFYIDADEILTKEAIDVINDLKANDFYGYKAYWCENPTESYYAPRLELFDKSYGFEFKGAVHEYIDPFTVNLEDIGLVKTPINHISNKDLVYSKAKNYLKIFQKSLEDGELNSVRDFYYYSCACAMAGDAKKAIQTCNVAIELYKLNPNKVLRSDIVNACDQIAMCILFISNDEESKMKAINCWKFALSIFERYDIHYFIADKLCELGNYSEAFEHIKAAKRISVEEEKSYDYFFVQKAVKSYYIPIRYLEIVCRGKFRQHIEEVEEFLHYAEQNGLVEDKGYLLIKELYEHF